MNRFEDLVRFEGRVEVAGQIQLPSNSVGDGNFAEVAPLTCEKQLHQHVITHAQVRGTASTDERRVIHVARGEGSVIEFRVGASVANVGDSTVEVDLLKNGTSILTAVAEIDSGDASYAKISGSIDTAGYSAGDVFEISIDATVGTGTLAQGVFAEMMLRESP